MKAQCPACHGSGWLFRVRDRKGVWIDAMLTPQLPPEGVEMGRAVLWEGREYKKRARCRNCNSTGEIETSNPIDVHAKPNAIHRGSYGSVEAGREPDEHSWVEEALLNGEEK